MRISVIDNHQWGCGMRTPIECKATLARSIDHGSGSSRDHAQVVRQRAVEARRGHGQDDCILGGVVDKLGAEEALPAIGARAAQVVQRSWRSVNALLDIHW